MAEDKIQCQICKQWFKQLTSTHLKNKHNIIFEEYKKMFPDAETHPQWLRDQLVAANIEKWSDSKYKEQTAKTISDRNKIIMNEPEITKKLESGSKRRWDKKEERDKYSDDRTGSGNPNYKHGNTKPDKYCRKFNEKFKEEIRDLFGRMCFYCYKTEEENDRKLSIHHVNCNKNCLCDSNCDFVALCESCHNGTNHNQDYWEALIMEMSSLEPWIDIKELI